MMKKMKNDEAAHLARALAMRGRSRQSIPITWNIVFLDRAAVSPDPPLA